MENKGIDLKTARFLYEGIISDVAQLLIEQNGMEITEALTAFNTSETAKKLADFETGLYIESPSYVYNLFLDELKYGKLTQ